MNTKQEIKQEIKALQEKAKKCTPGGQGFIAVKIDDLERTLEAM